MKLKRIRNLFSFRFSKKKKTEEAVVSGLDHLHYEFEIASSEKVDTSLIEEIILLNPYSLLQNPSIKMKEGKCVISFYTLSEEKGKLLEDEIRDMMI